MVEPNSLEKGLQDGWTRATFVLRKEYLLCTMRLIRWLINFLAATTVSLISFYFVISICILFFKLTGLVSDGPMYFDLQTPTYAGLFNFQAISMAIISACFAVRITFGKKSDFSFLRRNRRRERSE